MKKIRGLVLFIILFGIVVYWAWSQVIHYQVPDDLTNYQFTIEANESVSSILTRLESDKFIRHAEMLALYLRFDRDLATNLQAGNYTIAPGLNSLEVLASLRDGTFEIRATFIEGWRREEYAAYLSRLLGRDFADEFYRLTEEMEGQLFPDTYFIDADTTPHQLLDKIMRNYNEKIEEVGAGSTNEITGAQALVIASIVQRETHTLADQKLVAGIFIKRYLQGWALESDVTVQYALANARSTSATIHDSAFNWWPPITTAEDLEIDSVYNTRKHLGIPPAPICNPGLSALQAVVEPVSSPYWYFIADAEGIIRYATTLAEQNQHIAQFGLMEQTAP